MNDSEINQIEKKIKSRGERMKTLEIVFRNNKNEMINKIVENADSELLRDWATDYLHEWDEESIKEEYEKIEGDEKYD